MAGLQYGPLPSRLCLLSDLGTFSPGDKLRFLGCVTNYSTKTATLSLEHNYPPGNGLRALVDLKLVLGSIKSHESRVGEWVHVMGYIAAADKIPPNPPNLFQKEVPVQAIVLWSAGPLRLDHYEGLQKKVKAEESGTSNNKTSTTR